MINMKRQKTLRTNRDLNGQFFFFVKTRAMPDGSECKATDERNTNPLGLFSSPHK
jgi:hypothetical protein